MGKVSITAKRPPGRQKRAVVSLAVGYRGLPVHRRVIGVWIFLVATDAEAGAGKGDGLWQVSAPRC